MNKLLFSFIPAEASKKTLDKVLPLEVFQRVYPDRSDEVFSGFMVRLPNDEAEEARVIQIPQTGKSTWSQKELADPILVSTNKFEIEHDEEMRCCGMLTPITEDSSRFQEGVLCVFGEIDPNAGVVFRPLDHELSHIIFLKVERSYGKRLINADDFQEKGMSALLKNLNIKGSPPDRFPYDQMVIIVAVLG